MIRRLPLIPTIFVIAATAVMIALGVWQLRRGHEKDALLARYSASRSMPPITFPRGPIADEQLPLFRHSTAMCARPIAKRLTAGRNRTGEPGFAVIIDCVVGAEGPAMAIELGWSKNPNAPVNWRGGLVSGIIAPDGRSRMRLVAATAPPGLEPSAPPSLETIPNNHRSYAAQWFLFAAFAVGIFLIANRQRLAAALPAS